MKALFPIQCISYFCLYIVSFVQVYRSRNRTRMGLWLRSEYWIICTFIAAATATVFGSACLFTFDQKFKSDRKSSTRLSSFILLFSINVENQLLAWVFCRTYQISIIDDPHDLELRWNFFWPANQSIQNLNSSKNSSFQKMSQKNWFPNWKKILLFLFPRLASGARLKSF